MIALRARQALRTNPVENSPEESSSQLITYVDRLTGGGLKDLKQLLDGPLSGIFGGVHLLPFFHPIDGTDTGFDPIDHTQVDPRLGSWTALQSSGSAVEMLAELIVNHASTLLPQFLDFSPRGSNSPFAGIFLTLDRVFPNGANATDSGRLLTRSSLLSPIGEVHRRMSEFHSIPPTNAPYAGTVRVLLNTPEVRPGLKFACNVRTFLAASVPMFTS